MNKVPGVPLTLVDNHNPTPKCKKVDKWVPLCCTVVVEHVIVIDVLYLNTIINHCIRKMVLSGDVVIYAYK